MTDESAYWVWVFGDIDGLRWVIAHSTMAFPATAGPYLRSMSAGDRAVLYVTRGAFRNPTRDLARLAGLATALATPRRTSGTRICGKEFVWKVPIEIDIALPERAGPEVRPLVDRLSFINNKGVWGQYFRTSPKRIGQTDYQVLAQVVRDAVESTRK